ncbi:hypothetical protein LOZ53_004575 [Ophidiomyces ophidiicola]|nr:hypothetical protein LOZ55_002913 [Ophidiomyces ophidiicola]KAI1985498.1 hypothetical protein LOZ51_006411 [Ophidiomyces ophidiicola]KAI1986853.1 hypothetical protein LOZ53_004575 [Ophidiomyces ophidiicola]KAI1988497.1 hypothetical protein LOZ54_003179 [Ophidiomyces ophidiicola]
MAFNRPSRFFILSNPRSTSNLFVRILNLKEQPNVAKHEQNGYFFLKASFLAKSLGTSEKNIREWTETERSAMRQAYQDAFNDMEEYLCEAENNGKIAVVKEHCYMVLDPAFRSKFHFGQDGATENGWTLDLPAKYGDNPIKSEGNITLLPDAFLDTWNPIILIRHPALMFPSFCRAMSDLFHINFKNLDISLKRELNLALSLTCARVIYDWYAKRLGKIDGGKYQGESWPIVVDSDDVINRPELMIKLADMIGLDRDSLQFTWEKEQTENNGHPISTAREIMLSTLLSSTGIISSRAATDIDIDIEANKWREEFGEEAGKYLEDCVKAAMPDYEFLKDKRLK